MIADPLLIEEIFEQALLRVPGAERTAFVDESCGQDTELRVVVEGLLKAVSEAGSFMMAADSPGLLPTQDSVPAELVGNLVGPYKLLEQIGEGGMGVVWLAEQQQPVRRRVALKVIKPGMDSRQVLARFEAERQALSLMDHPNIAKVLDAGTIEAGGRRPETGGREPPRHMPPWECGRRRLSIGNRLG